MLLHLFRISTTHESTQGALYLDGTFFCYTVEDAWKATKEAGTTRIPQGVYKIFLRDEGGMTQAYRKKFSDMHEGMLHLQDVPEFKHVYIHYGNTAKNTLGCILVGDTAKNNSIGEGFVGSSINAYKRLYPKVALAVRSGLNPHIRISDLG